MAQLPNPWISNSVVAPVPTESAVAMRPPPVPAAAEPFAVSDGALVSSLPSVEMEPSVTAAYTPSETEGAVSVSTASFDISHIHEIFHYVRKLMKQPSAFVLDEGRFLADIDEEPLFLRADGYLQRREA